MSANQNAITGEGDRRAAGSRVLLPLRFGKKLWNSLSGGNPADFTLWGRERTLRAWNQVPQTVDRLRFPGLRDAIIDLHSRASNNSLPSYHYQKSTPQPWFDPLVLEAVVAQLNQEVGVVNIRKREGFYIPKPARDLLRNWRDGGKKFPWPAPGVEFIAPEGFISREENPVEWDLMLEIELRSLPSDLLMVRLALLLGQDHLYLEDSGRAFLSPRVSTHETYRSDGTTRKWMGSTGIRYRSWLIDGRGIPAVWSDRLPAALLDSMGKTCIGEVRSLSVERQLGRLFPITGAALPTVQVVDWIIVVLLWETWLDGPNPPDEVGGTFGLFMPQAQSVELRIAASQGQALFAERWRDRCGHLGISDGSRLVLRSDLLFRVRRLLRRSSHEH
jgi:hypothetical protein